MHVRPLKLWDSAGVRREGVCGVPENRGLLSLGCRIQGVQEFELKSVVGHYEGMFVKAGGCANDFLA